MVAHKEMPSINNNNNNNGQSLGHHDDTGPGKVNWSYCDNKWLNVWEESDQDTV